LSDALEKQELEALLFATESPLTIARLRKIFPAVGAAEIKAAVAALADDYAAQERAFTVVEFGGGYQIATRPEYAPLVEKLLRGRRYARLSRAGLEVLAIVAYRQPLTRLEIDEIRGVQSAGALATLTERNLVTVVGRSEAVGHPLLYGTTREFLNHLGLSGLHQLPPLPDLASVIEDRESLREFASQFGEEITDEEIEELQDPTPVPDEPDADVAGVGAPEDEESARAPAPGETATAGATAGDVPDAAEESAAEPAIDAADTDAEPDRDEATRDR
jgi:segregation and condensation protein B